MNRWFRFCVIVCCLVVMTPQVSLSAADAAADNLELKADIKKQDHLFKAGEPVEFNITLLKDGKGVAGTKLGYMLEGDAAITGPGKTETGSDGTATIKTRLDRPGFVRCTVSCKNAAGKEIQKRIGAAIEPEKLLPGRTKPADFDAYWDNIIAESKALPFKVELIPVPVANANYQDKVEMFDVKINTLGDKPFIYGYLCLPKNAAPKSLPIVMSYQGAGFRSASQTFFAASKGRMILDINAHGLLNGQSPEYYKKADQDNSDYRVRGSESRDTLYFRGMIIRAVRALQYMKTRTEWDGKTIIVSGGSQGGGQALAVAGLDPDVTFCFAGVPALTDHGGEVAGREGGWPKIIRTQKLDPAVITACDYIDAAFFASRIRNAQCLLSVGFFDPVCPSSCVYAAYNSIPAKQKQIIHDINSDHTMPQETFAIAEKAIEQHIQKNRQK